MREDTTMEIPVLKKKEEERRGGAVPPPFLLRTAGVRLAAGSPRVSGSALSDLFMGLNGRGGLFAMAGLKFQRLVSLFSRGELTALGAGVLATLALCALSLAQAVGSQPARVEGWSFEARAEESRPASLPEAPRPTLGSLIAAEAPAPEPEAPAVEAKPAEAAPEAPEPPASDPTVDAQAIVDSVVSGAQTSGKLVPGTVGRGASGVSSGMALRDSLNSFNGVKTFGTLPAMKELGRLTPPVKGAARRLSSRLSGQLGARSTRAMGQLKFARAASLTALGSVKAEPSHSFAAAAFDQAATLPAGGSIGGGGLSGGETVGPMGGGAPDLTTAPSVGPGENKTPYQDKVDKAKQNVNMALMLVVMGLTLLAIGAMVMIYAKGMMASIFTAAAGAKLMKFGMMLLVAGAMALAAGAAAAMMAKNKGKEISKDYGQPEQGAVIDSCAGQAVKPKKCKAPGVVQPTTTVHDAVVAESTASFGYDNGGPVNQ